MSEERKLILEMLAAGKVTADEAEKLLEKLEESEEGRGRDQESRSEPSDGKTTPRHLRIEVNDEAGKTVNLRVPLSFMGTGMALAGVLPQRVRQRLAEKGIDMGLFAGIRDPEKCRQMTDALRELDLDVDEDGRKVRIYCE